MREIQLNGKKAAGRVALVDDEDYELMSGHSWHVWEQHRPGRHRATGPYACAAIRRDDGTLRHVYMHQLITRWPITDHANGDGLDNRRSNLRPVDHAQNNWNSAKRGGGTSRFKGVSWRERDGKWQVHITVSGKRRFLGCFASEEDAAAAYTAAALEIQGQYAYAARDLTA